MKTSKFAICLIYLVLASNIFAQEIRPGFAVYNLEGRGISDGEALALTDRLRSELSALPEFSQQYSMTERNEMEKVLKEQALQLTGACSEASCIKQIGQILAVKKMLGGSISKIGQLYTVAIRMIDVENGTIEKSVTEDYSGGIEMLLTRIMPKIARRLVGVEGVQKPVFGGNSDLYIKSDPTGGVIYIDDQPMAQVTPVTLKGLFPGTHTIRVETNIYEKDTTVTLGVKDFKTLSLLLSKKVRKLRVSTNPQEAEIFSDTILIGRTPLERPIFNDGVINLRIIKQWYVAVFETLKIEGPRLYEIERTLSPCGEITFKSTPPEAQVLIDGKEAGVTPLRLPIPLGVHQMVLIKQGFNDITQEINMDAQEARTLSYEMENKSAYLTISGSPEGATVTANDAIFIGKTPLLKKAINWGSYAISVTAPGYRDSAMALTVDKDTNYVLQVDLHRKSRMVAGVVSLLLPGSGQSYSGRRGWGNLYRYAGLACVAAAVYFIFSHQNNIKEYNSSIIEYNAAETMDHIILAREDMVSKHDKAETSQKLLQTAITATAVLWSINLVDAVAFFPGQPKVAAKIQHSQNGQRAGLSLTYNW